MKKKHHEFSREKSKIHKDKTCDILKELKDNICKEKGDDFVKEKNKM
jgi:hypothetical protein